MKLKRAIQIIIFAVIFLIALFVWNFFLGGKRYQAVSEITQASLPVITLNSGNTRMNQMHGYTGAIDTNMIRDSITPVTGSTISATVSDGEVTPESLNYQLYSGDNKTVMGKGVARVKGKKAAIQMKGRLESGRTYLLCLSFENEDGRNVRYYTRIFYGTAFRYKEAVKFANKFHDATLNEGGNGFITQFLETKEGATVNNLASVDLKSDENAVCYSQLKPKTELTFPVTIKDVSSTVTSLELQTLMSSENQKGVKQYYTVTEYFRIRYSAKRMYLLNYKRTQNSYMRNDGLDRANNRLLIGIADNRQQVISKDGGKIAALVQNHELWCYNVNQASMTKVFSFIGENYNDVRNNYHQHGIRVLSMKKNGEISFMVYGYMNRGAHEGKNGIAVYRYSPADEKAQELVFIPVKVQYETIASDLEKGAYLSGSNEFYFFLDGSLYRINTKEGDAAIVEKHITNDFGVISDDGMVAIQANERKIRIMNLSSGKKYEITGNDGQQIKPLGFIGEDFVYGISRDRDLTFRENGTILLPMSEVRIINRDNQVLKKYKKSKRYITDATVEGTVVTLTRAVKKKDKFVSDKTIYIRYKGKKENKAFLQYGYTTTLLNQLYLAFPENVYVQTVPEYMTAKIDQTTDEEKVQFVENPLRYQTAYVYAGGELVGSYRSMKEAIAKAKKEDGIVVNCRQSYLWEKGVMKTYGKVANIKMYKANKKDSGIACVKMMAYAQGRKVTEKDIEVTQGNLYDLLNRVFDRMAVNETGCSLDDILYSVDRGRPIIAKRKNGSFLLIISYNSTKIRYIDPVKGKSVAVDRKSLEAELKKAGSVYYSFGN